MGILPSAEHQRKNETFGCIVPIDFDSAVVGRDVGALNSRLKGAANGNLE